jgi:pyruvate dehydrogenase E2 component (dihydrolipoamide acetyltransferase)
MKEERYRVITPVVMPQMGLEVTEGTVAAICVELGATVSEGATLVELETDKALSEVPAPRAGVVDRIDVKVGDTVAVGAPLVILADERGEASAIPAGDARTARNERVRMRSAPVARRAAAQLGIELAGVTGTGPRGRITLADVELAAAQTPSAAAERPAAAQPRSNGDAAELIQLTATRRAIARRMTQSQAIPQFSLERELDATRLLADKDAFPDPQEGAPKATLNDMLVQALGEILLRHPELAGSYTEGGGGEPMVIRRSAAGVGLAVATDRGLMVPVIRGAHERALSELAADRVRLMGAARSGRLTLAQMSGAAVTLSNLGGFGVDRFGAMLNPGEAAILAVGRTIERVVPRGRGTAIVPTLSLTLTIDHRVIDGAGGAAVLVDLADLLEGEMAWRP